MLQNKSHKSQVVVRTEEILHDPCNPDKEVPTPAGLKSAIEWKRFFTLVSVLISLWGGVEYTPQVFQ